MTQERSDTVVRAMAINIDVERIGLNRKDDLHAADAVENTADRSKI